MQSRSLGQVLCVPWERIIGQEMQSVLVTWRLGGSGRKRPNSACICADVAEFGNSYTKSPFNRICQVTGTNW